MHNENEHTNENFMEGSILLKERTQMMNNKIKLHILTPVSYTHLTLPTNREV